jgi:hypothetical protein
VVPPDELRDPLKEFDAVCERELKKLERVKMGGMAAIALRKAMKRIRAEVDQMIVRYNTREDV